MSFFTTLFKSYNYGLNHGMIDKNDDNTSLILPLYHNSMKSNGKNIIEIKLDKESNLIDAYFLKNEEIVIFPVTEDSVSRSSGVSPHPLYDNFDYLVKDNSKKSLAYLDGLSSWLNYENIDFVRIFYNFINRDKAFDEVLIKLYGDYKIKNNKNIEYIDKSSGKSKKLNADFSKIYLSYKIENYDGLRDVSITDNKVLHKKYIDYVNYLIENDKETPKIICNISGEEDYLCLKHKPLIGSAKLISQITANDENFFGRFDDPSQTIKIGKNTSQKIMLMAKSLLDCKNTSRWLGGLTYALSWFSDDIQNQSNFDLGKNIKVDNPIAKNKFLTRQLETLPKLDSHTENIGIKLADEISENIVKSFTSGKILFSLDSNYYFAVVDKISNGRVSVRYFSQIRSSDLIENLNQWQRNYHRFGYSKEDGSFSYTPSLRRFIFAAYGVERDGKLEIDKDSFLTSQFSNLMAAIVEGRKMPQNIIKALEINIGNRQKYDKTWKEIKLCTLAALRNKEEIDNNMLDRKKLDRSYLYGRLLALYELIESNTYSNDDARVTNAEKLWSSFINNPVTINFRLRTLVMPYRFKLKADEKKRKLCENIDKEISTISNLISDNYDDENPSYNKPLGPAFIFGYEGQKNYIEYITYKKTKETEEEN